MCVLSIGFCLQFSCGDNAYRFPYWTDGKRCKSLLSPSYILFLSYLLLHLSLIESLRVRLSQSVFRSENIGTDVFRCGADSAQYKSIYSIYCITEGTCYFCRFLAEAYRCVLVCYCVFSPVTFSQNLVVSGATVGNVKDPGTSL